MLKRAAVYQAATVSGARKMKVYDYIRDVAQLHSSMQMFWSTSSSCK